MMSIPGVLLAMLIICLVSSDKEGRAAARIRVNRWARWLLLPTIVMGAMLLWPVAQWIAERY